MTPRTILIVDDDSDLRTTLVEQLALHEEFAVLQEARPPRASPPRETGRSTCSSWMSACPTWTDGKP